MNLVEKIKSESLNARKQRDVPLANILTTLISEAEAIAKESQRPLQDEDVEQTAKKFLKNLKKNQQLKDTEEVRFEISVVEEYIPKAPEIDLEKVVQDVYSNNPDVDEKKLFGLVMRETKGQADQAELKALINKLI